jgi:hypothetical protein
VQSGKVAVAIASAVVNPQAWQTPVSPPGLADQSPSPFPPPDAASGPPTPLPGQVFNPWVPPAPQPGQLTTMWRTWFVVVWTLVLVGFGFVWGSSRTLGLSTWWLGPEAEPQPFFLQMVPLIGPVAATVCAFRNVRYTPFIGIVIALASSFIGFADLGRIAGLGLVELLLSGCGLLISIASLAGMYRRTTTTT